MVDCLHDYRTAITIHGDDVLAHSNWEISESWFRRYKYVTRATVLTVLLIRVRFLSDAATLNVANRWRRERGEPELPASEYVIAEGSS